MRTPLPPVPVKATGPIDPSPIVVDTVPDDLTPIWRAVNHLIRARNNDIHLPISMAFADRLCAAYPEADAQVVRVSVLLHDIGWALVDEDRILSEGFSGDWRKAEIRFEHERQACNVAREILPGLGYSDEFVEDVCAIIDGHDTRPEALSLEDALMRDADRLWRFDHAGIALAHTWFKLTPSAYMDRLGSEIIPELLTEAGIAMGTAHLERSRRLLLAEVLA